MPDKKDLLLAKVIESKSSVNIILPGIKDDVTDEKYTYIKQGNATNKLAKARSSEVDILGNATFKSEDFKASIYKKANTALSKLNTVVKVFLDYLVMDFTQQGSGDTKVSVKLKDFMKARNLKDIKETRKQVLTAMKAIDDITLDFSDKHNGKVLNRINIKISGGSFGIVNGVIFFRFNHEFASILRNYSVMHYPLELFGFNAKYNPHSYHLLRTMAEHKKMNRGKPNADIMSVKTLIEACPSFPRYEEIERKSFSQKILEPFERDMDAIKSISWQYCNTNGTEAEAPDTHLEFQKAKVLILWKEHPDNNFVPQKKPKKNKLVNKKS